MKTPETRDRKGAAVNRCPDARALLPAYVENELSGMERARVQGHLDICSACRTEEATYRVALGALSAAPKPAHGDLYYGLAAKLDALERRPVFRPRQLRWAGALACLVLAVGVGATVVGQRLLSHHRTDTPKVVLPYKEPTPEPLPVKTVGKGNEAPQSPDVQPFVPEVVPHVNEDQPGEDTAADNTYKQQFQPAQTPDRSHRRGGRTDGEGKAISEVRDSQGRSLNDILEEFRKNNRVIIDKTVSPPVPTETNIRPAEKVDEAQTKQVDLPSMPDVRVMVQEKEKREKDGETIVKSRRETGYNKHGKLALIKLDLHAEPAPATPTRSGGSQPRKTTADEGN